MSDDHDSQSTPLDRSPSPGHPADGNLRANGEADRERGDGSGPSVRTATVDRGGSPFDDPSPAHRAVAARERLWGSYQGGGKDGCFVWTAPGEDPGGGRD